MPSAPDAEREWAERTFGGIDARLAIAWLERRGFRLRTDWTWDPPARSIATDEWRAVQFLILEWDFGGVRP